MTKTNNNNTPVRVVDVTAASAVKTNAKFLTNALVAVTTAVVEVALVSAKSTTVLIKNSDYKVIEALRDNSVKDTYRETVEWVDTKADQVYDAITLDSIFNDEETTTKKAKSTTKTK